MIRRSLPLLVLATLVLLPATLSMGDTLILKNGAKFEGKVVGETSTHVIFKIQGMGKQKFRKSDILKIEEGKSIFDEYTERKRGLRPDDADGHYELGMWCKENELRKEAKKAFETAVEADPDHAGAREELGFVHYEQEWITKARYDEIMAEIAEREGDAISRLALKDEPYSDKEASFVIGVPKGDWEIEKDEGVGVVYTGPELGEVPVTISLDYTSEDATLAENLDEFVNSWLEKLAEDYEKFKKAGAPTSAKLAGGDGKLVSTTYTRDDITPDTVPIERRDLIATFAGGYLRLSLECRSGYAEKLSGFFEKIRASVKKYEESAPAAGPSPGGAGTLDRSFTLTLPDESYATAEAFPIQFNTERGNIPLRPAANSELVRSTTNMAFFVAREGELPEGATLQTIRDELINITNVKGFVQPAGNERSTKVAGVDALAGNVSMRIGNQALGGGYFCVFKKGDRYYQCVFLNFGNQMGEQYAKPDFQKFLDGFKFK